MTGTTSDPDRVFGRIVVGVDRRQGGRDALALATLLQGVCGGELVALYVYPYDIARRFSSSLGLATG